MSLRRRLKHYLTYGIQKRIRGFKRKDKNFGGNGTPKEEVRGVRSVQTTDKGAN